MSVFSEIVTIQVGSYANFIGTHWWNIQESSFCYDPNSSNPLDINHDVLFREGENLKGEVTYTPRLLVVDFKHNLKDPKQTSNLYRDSENEPEAPIWDGIVDVIQNPAQRFNALLEGSNNEHAESNLQNAESSGTSVKESSDTIPDYDSNETAWSDFLTTCLHPRSFCLLDGQRSNEEETPLELYSSGVAAYNIEVKDSVEDCLRKLIEECDYLQGFQVLFDSHNGYSGITSCVLQHINDEYHRKPTLSFPIYQSDKTVIENRRAQMHRLYAVLASLSNLNSHCSLFSPLSLTDDVITSDSPYRKFPYIQYNETSLYQTSALIAASIETLTSQYRLKSPKFRLYDITDSMSLHGRKFVSTNVSLPFPMNEDLHLSSMIDNGVPEYSMTSLTPFCSSSSNKSLMQYAVLRGIPKSKFLSSHKSQYQGLGPEELFGQYLNKYSSSSVTAATVFEENVSLGSTFPNFFTNTVGTNGYLSASPRPANKGLSKVPSAACFANTDNAGEFIASLLTLANKRSFRDYLKSTDFVVEKDEYNEAVENVMDLQENYQHYM